MKIGYLSVSGIIAFYQNSLIKKLHLASRLVMPMPEVVGKVLFRKIWGIKKYIAFVEADMLIDMKLF